MIPAVVLVPALVAVVYLLLRVLSLLPAAVRVDRVRQRQQILGGHRQELAAARADLRRRCEAIPLPRRITDWAVGDDGWTD